VTPGEEDRLLAQAIAFAMDMREDLAAAHRTVRYLDRADLEALTCALGAMVDPNLPLPVMAWWRTLATAREAA